MIFEPNEQFAFDKLKLLSPVMLNSAQFIRFKLDGSASPCFFIQSPKFTVKENIPELNQSLQNKKRFSDFVFTRNEEDFLNWVERLEHHTHKIIYDNRNEWFDAEWSKSINSVNDIADFFKPTLKSLRRGDIYYLRVEVLPDVKIYDQSENEISANALIDEELVSILEFKGIKCTSTNFQIEIVVKQIMTIPPLFSKCLIKKSQYLGNTEDNQPLYENPQTEKEHEEIPAEVSAFNLDDLEIEPEEMQIKDRSEIHKEMYKMAYQRAKVAKQLALKTYLELQQIKNTYMLNDIENDDSDEDEDN